MNGPLPTFAADAPRQKWVVILSVCFLTTRPFSLQVQRMSASLKVFRCGPWRNSACQEMAARVDKPRKDEAAGGLVRLWGKRADGRCDGCFGGLFGVFHGGGSKGIAYL